MKYTDEKLKELTFVSSLVIKDKEGEQLISFYFKPFVSGMYCITGDQDQFTIYHKDFKKQIKQLEKKALLDNCTVEKTTALYSSFLDLEGLKIVFSE
jgi:hypothetical protein